MAEINIILIPFYSLSAEKKTTFTLEKFNKAIDEGHDEPDDVPIDKDYADEVISTWQTILQQKLPTDDGPKK